MMDVITGPGEMVKGSHDPPHTSHAIHTSNLMQLDTCAMSQETTTWSLLPPQIARFCGLLTLNIKCAASSVSSPQKGLILPARGHEYLKTFFQPLEPQHTAALPLNLCPESLPELLSLSHPP